MLNSLTQSQPTTTVGLVVFFLLFFIAPIVISIDTPEKEARCLNCIRNVSSSLGVDVTKRCESYYCGPYQLSYTYWAEAGKPGNNQGLRDYEKCARDKNCAEQTVRAYFKKFKRDCNKDGLIDCQDMAALHKGGPTSCASDWFYKSRYWLAFNKTSCMTVGDQPDSLDQSASDINKQNKNFMNLENSQNLKHPDGIIAKNQSLTTECLECICEAVTGCNTSTNNCGSGAVCGPFAISQAYWKDGRKPGASWTACARTKECSSVTVKNYMEKYKRDCNDDGYITCEDYAAIHRRGPKACSNRDLLKDNYWNKFLACRANQKPAKDVNMVKVSDDLAAHASVLASRGDTNLLSSIRDSASSTTSTTPTTTTTTTARTTTSQLTQAQSSSMNHLALTKTYLTSSPPLEDFSNLRKGLSSASGKTSVSIAGASSLPAQTTIAAIESTKFDYAQTPTYELTSMVLNIKDDNQSKGANSDGNPSLEASTIRNQHFQQPQPPQQHDREQYGNVASNTDDEQHGLVPTQNDQLDQHLPSGSSSTKLESEPIVDSRPTPSGLTDHELSGLSRGTDYELPMGSSPESSLSQTPTATTTTDAATSFVPNGANSYQSTATATATTATTASISSASSTLTTSKQRLSDDQTPTSPNQENVNHHQQLEPLQSSQASNIATEQQLVANVRLPIFAMPAMSPGEEMIDYSVPDFSFPSQASSADRVNNFDRVVTGIVGSPDFSRSYPPVPDLLTGVDKQTSEQQQQQQQSASDEQQQSLVTKTNHQLTVNTNHSRNPNSNGNQSPQQSGKHPNSPQLQIVESPQRVHTRIAPIVNPSPSSSERLNQQQQETMTTMNKNANDSKQQRHQQQQNKQQPLLTKPSPDTFSAGESLNMSSLFENGSLNESSKIASECLECICDASSNCDTTVQCISKQREKNRCGLYMISWNQYQESDISLTSLIPAIGGNSGASGGGGGGGGSSSEELADEKMYYECTTDRACAEKLIHLYIEKHQRDCNNDGKIDCFDIAAIHRVGPENCNSSKFLASQYWKDFNICYATDRITTTTSSTSATTAQASPIFQSSPSSSSTLPHPVGLYS